MDLEKVQKKLMALAKSIRDRADIIEDEEYKSQYCIDVNCGVVIGYVSAANFIETLSKELGEE